jgi:hypothetical protein
MKVSSVLFLLLFSLMSFSQKKWDPEVLRKANTAKDAVYLSAEEKKVIFYLNLVRLDPKLFAETYAKKHLDSAGKNTSFAKSLLKALPSTKPMEVLMPAKDLSEFAKEHAVKSGKENKVGHGNFDERFRKIKKTYGSYVGENCDYGYNKALDIVMRLLIDEDVPSLGHRKNILNPKYKYVGTSIKPHQGYQWNCVMDFAG